MIVFLDVSREVREGARENDNHRRTPRAIAFSRQTNNLKIDGYEEGYDIDS